MEVLGLDSYESIVGIQILYGLRAGKRRVFAASLMTRTAGWVIRRSIVIASNRSTTLWVRPTTFTR